LRGRSPRSNACHQRATPSGELGVEDGPSEVWGDEDCAAAAPLAKLASTRDRSAR
jgi:hypothetical protein